MRYGFLILIALCIFFCREARAQNKTTAQPLPGYIFRTLDNNNGLLYNQVMAITQDQRGFMWIGTTKGLQRYDGLQFVNYYDRNDSSGPNSWLMNLYPDEQDNSIWFTKGAQLKKLQVLRNEFITLEPEQIKKKEGEKFTDHLGNDWFLHRTYQKQSGHAGERASGQLLVNDPVSRLTYFAHFIENAPHHETWFIDINHKLLLLNDSSRKIYSAANNPISHPLLTHLKNFLHGNRNLTIDSQGNIWIVTWGEYLFRYNRITQQFSSYSITDIMQAEGENKKIGGWVNKVMEDNHGKLWIGTANAGILQYNPAKDNFNYIVYQHGNSTGIQYNSEIFELFQDKEENIWLGTDKGISVFNPYRQFFTIIQHEPYNIRSMPKSEITSVIETARGDLLVGTWGGGISVYDKTLNFKKTIYFADNESKNKIWCFIQNDNGSIWAGCQTGYLHILDTAKLSVRTIQPREFGNSTIRCMEKDPEGNIWAGLHNGKIIQWHKRKNTFIGVEANQQINPLYEAPISNIFIDAAQNFWISTDAGFRQFDATTHAFMANYMPDRKKPGSISSPFIHGVEEYNDSVLLVGTEDGGVNFFDKKKKSFSTLAITKDNLPYSVSAIKKDQLGNIWFTANNQIYKNTPRSNKFVACTPGREIMNSFFSGKDFLVSRSGQWFAWTVEKVIGFYPDSIKEQQISVTPVTITGFKVFDKPVFIDLLQYAGKPVQLSYKQNFLTIEFASLRFYGIGQTNYFYQLKGVDKGWVDAGTKQFASYTNLTPGKYSFLVKTETGNNVGTATVFNFIIEAPFWQTTWFRFFSIAIITGLAIGFIRWRIGNIRHEADLKHKIAESEMLALRAQMNPHFIFNSLNAIDNLVQTNQKDKATTYLARFAKLIRGILDSSKNNVVSFQKDFESLRLYLQMEQFRCDNKFDYKLTADAELDMSDFKIPPLVVQPFVENAIHHGLLNKQQGVRRLELSATLEKDYIKYIIIDSGVGRVRAQQIKEINKPDQQSYGLNITRERIQLHNQSQNDQDLVITDLYENNEPAGTQVTVRIRIYDTT